MQQTVHGLTAQEQTANHNLYRNHNNGLHHAAGQQNPKALAEHHGKPNRVEHQRAKNLEQHNSGYN